MSRVPAAPTRPSPFAPLIAVLAACGGGSAASPSPAPSGDAGPPYPAAAILSNGLRNKYEWPFASDSIWNVPIGSEARYVPAGIGVTAMGMNIGAGAAAGALRCRAHEGGKR